MRLRVLLLGAVLLGGCVWRSYERVMTVHLEVLSGMLGKMVSVVDAGRRPAPNDMTEMLYPLERAELFLLQHQDRKDTDSFQGFAAFLERYRQLVTAVDDARTDAARWEAQRARLRSDAEAMQSGLGPIHAALARER